MDADARKLIAALNEPLNPPCRVCGQPGTLHYEPGAMWVTCGCPADPQLALPEWNPVAATAGWKARRFGQSCAAATPPPPSGPPMVLPRSTRGAPPEDDQPRLI